VRFDWDRDKEAVNVAKHGVDFSEAQSAFADPLLVLAADKGHSQKEPRLFCIGRSGRGGIDSRCANRSSASVADLTVYPPWRITSAKALSSVLPGKRGRSLLRSDL
jgi:hypothetical protein